MKRVSLSLLIIAMAFALVVSAGAANPVTITYWTFFAGGDAEYMEDLIAGFNEAQDEVYVEEEVIPWGEYYTRLTAAIAGGNAPDIGIFHVTHLPSFVQRNVFLGLDDYLDAVDFPVDDFNPVIWEAVQLDGSVYAIPIDTHPEVFYYNTDLFEAVGWVENDTVRIPQTPDELVEFGQAIKDYDDNLVPYALDTAGGGVYRIWLGLMSQLGGRLLEDDNRTPAMNSPEGYEALDLLKTLIVDHDFGEVGTSAQLLFREQDAAVQVGGVWNTGVHEQQEGLNFAATMVPPIFGANANWANSHAIVIPMQRGGMDDDKVYASLTFLDWLTEHGADWARAGHIPPRMSVLESEEFTGQPYRPAYAEAAEYAVFLPPTTEPSELESALNETIEAVYHGQLTVQEALDQMETAVRNILR